jgi:hypothetical protein
VSGDFLRLLQFLYSCHGTTRGAEGEAASSGRWRGLPVALSCFRQKVAALLASCTFADISAELSLSKQYRVRFVVSSDCGRHSVITMVIVKLILVRSYVFVCVCVRERAIEIRIFIFKHSLKSDVVHWSMNILRY